MTTKSEIFFSSNNAPLIYKGVWDSSTATLPVIANYALGSVLKVSVDATVSTVFYKANSYIINDSGTWQRLFTYNYNDLNNLPTIPQGTVTSISITVPTGLQVSGSPITTNGTFGIVFQSGYSIPLNTSQTNWDTAFTLASTALQDSDIGVSVAPLENNLIPAIYLPSYVDDVITVTDYASLPVTGETGKIYIVETAGTHEGTPFPANQQFRWSGTVYILLVASPGTTSNIVEGSNLYFTNVRAISAPLTGFVAATTNFSLLAADTTLQAFEKIEGHLNNLDDSIPNYISTADYDNSVTVNGVTIRVQIWNNTITKHALVQVDFRGESTLETASTMSSIGTALQPDLDGGGNQAIVIPMMANDNIGDANSTMSIKGVLKISRSGQIWYSFDVDAVFGAGGGAGTSETRFYRTKP